MAANFEVLPGLPAVGPYPEQFAPDGRPTHSEGLVVRVLPRKGEPWVGNFQRGLSKLDAVLAHPNGNNVIVIAGGQAYEVRSHWSRRPCVDPPKGFTGRSINATIGA